MTGEILLQIVMAMISALGFGLLFHISGSRLITIMLGAAVNWGVYLLAMQWYDNRVTAFFVSTLATAALAEVLARLLKAPVITLLVPMLVPLIPGGDLYYTTLALVQGDTAGFARYGTLFIEEAGAMAFGVILVACCADSRQAVAAAQCKKIKATPLCGIASVCQKNIILIFTLRAAARIK